MKQRILTLLLGTALFAVPAFAQQKTVTGKVTNEVGAPVQGAQIGIKGTTIGTLTNADGNYSIRATVGQTLLFRYIGHAPQDIVVGADNVINVQLKKVATSLDAMVVTALGQTAQQRSLGTSQQSVDGAAIAQTQRENFINALQGRVAGVDVTSTSGVPGASTSITIRGVSSISSSNQPLMIVDGLPLDNKTLNTGVLASDAPGSLTAFSNRGVDFTNRAADINPDDIETMVVLKGPEASALYGIDAANGAIVITTKRGKAGEGGFEYSNNFRVESTNSRPAVQHMYGPTVVAGQTLGSFQYFGAPYPGGTQFYDNIDGFFQTAVTQRHNLAFSGASQDNRINYRLAVSADKQQGVIPNSDLSKVNVTASSQAQVTRWLRTDLSLAFANSDNNQAYKGDAGPLIGLLVWPATDKASDYLSPAGTRKRLTSLAQSSELDNPYFNVNKNINNSKTSRLLLNTGFVLTPFSWGEIKTNIGVDGYTSQDLILRNPESALGYTNNGILDIADDITRNINMQTLLNFHPHTLTKDLSISGFVGHSLSDAKSTVDASEGLNFLDPNFISINNTSQRTSRTTITQRRLVSAFGSASLDFRRYLYLNVTGRNDWTSTIPVPRNSFFYPSISSSFIFSDAFPSIARYVTGKIRAGWAEVGRDALPYSYRPSLEYKTTTFGGYGYGFTGPNLALKPEFAKSYEIGTELSFLDDRLGLDVTYYKKRTEDQIVQNIRGSYATGYILFNLNGATTENHGWEVTLRGTPIMKRDFTWDVQANFASMRGKVISLPNALPETYVSDTWLYGNVRNGTMPGLSTMSLTGLFYLRNNQGQLLIDPTTGLPLRSSSFIDAGYDRQPDYTVGITNTLRYKRWTLDFLVDIRKGGDIFNATEHYLTTRGLAMSTLDRETPRVIKGVLRDGKENSANPTPNNIVVVPATNTLYYTNMSEELFIEKNINWLRLRDVTLRYNLPDGFLFHGRNASLFITATDLFLITNYTGLDPIVNGNTAAVGGSGGAGIDFGNFPIPRGVSFGLKVGF
ncbi:MAG: SusC/RagA family TonB-linked outer membrane protein [Proteobacteria bacterium]|nr:SusC/RagA family TonB-linked outer membrane protein [Pseudomonadota bacterium]